MTDQLPESLRWENQQLYLLDQRLLPHEIVYVAISSLPAAWEAINTLTVRGAPAIGIAAAYALAQSMKEVAAPAFTATLKKNAEYLKSARPTAVNLAWAVDTLVKSGLQNPDVAALIQQAKEIHRADIRLCENIGRHGSSLIKPGMNLLTHCNAGALAVSRHGTATAPMYHQHQRGVNFHVYVDETRPLYQGARLTAWELDRSGIPVTLICDNMAATLMARNKIDLVLVGTDRVTANGDVINKIGTLNLAVLCHHFNVPFYVACPSTTYDANTLAGEDVEIEERAADEIKQRHAADVTAFNPAFDVTPAQLVTGIITEQGIAHDARSLSELIARQSAPRGIQS
ncbi:MAG: S-methyl-5-thioribose-1-phosphate isomerase [Gammaproteobacteria bacterium]|jgi:methylthioribose-1-phosphate isomerase|nr:S-methyl-5-thioribose-1-phosphate isomerase [Gammaproteobacteria bacterium]